MNIYENQLKILGASKDKTITNRKKGSAAEAFKLKSAYIIVPILWKQTYSESPELRLPLVRCSLILVPPSIDILILQTSTYRLLIKSR